MATETTFLSWWIVSKFFLPFLLSFFLFFAVLEKTKLFGENKKQLNSLISFVISLIFVSAVYPKLVVSNLILFLSVALIAVFVIFLIWGFIFGESSTGFKAEGWMKLVLGIVAGIAFIIALFWATGWNEKLGSFVTETGLKSPVFTNLFFIIIIAVALALSLSPGKSGGK